ncbi:hypothetical protein M2475_001085 [Breznakia sp. PF5-3]|uniref:hypothetical protein n=1 Tax=unclassified Breznakia TaxID=2623764 RepID=UPI002405D17C|nr:MULTISPECIES: hypothetical protein [unclassified Breznakia]MDF9824295.1 hypothetical protein [Breznakia sp. PM6-1]MDF9835519.1 hypothetical protein [Breznakia sp. PF5-3]
MGKTLIIKPIICMDALLKMRKAAEQILKMYEHDLDDLLANSTGKSVEELKVMVMEMHGLKTELYDLMKELSDEIDSYLKEHIELDEKTALKIRTQRE